jgi:hypothetical protein
MLIYKTSRQFFEACKGCVPIDSLVDDYDANMGYDLEIF